MNWCDERYVRLYTRDSLTWLGFSFEAQALLALLIRKLDRAGVLELGNKGKRGVAMAIGHGSRWATLEPALEELLLERVFVIDGDRLVMPNFLEAQEAKQTDRVRQQESRARRREHAHVDVTNRDAESRHVTERHAPSQPVTDGHSVLSRAVPSVPSQYAEASPPLPFFGETVAPKKPAPEKPTADYSAFVDAYFAAYRARAGTSPTFGKAEGKIAKDLLAAHKLPLCLERLDRMFNDPPAWLAKEDTVPTIKTLKGAFDSLARNVAGPPSSRSSQADALLASNARLVARLGGNS